MTGGLVFVIELGDPSGEPSPGWQSMAWPQGVDIEVHRDTPPAIEALGRWSDAGRGPVAVVIHGQSKRALVAARQVVRRDPIVQIVFVADAAESQELLQAMGLAPRIGTYWTIVPRDSERLIPGIVEAARSTRQRRQQRTTLDRVRTQIAQLPLSENPDGSDTRRLIISDRYLAAILAHAHDAILSTDPAGKILTANAAATEMTGFGEHELLARHLPQLAIPSQADDVAAQLRRVREGHTEVQGELRWQHRDGSAIDVDIRMAPIRDESGQLFGISAIVRDIRQRKQAEEALREQREWLRVTLTSIGDAVIATDTEGRVAFLNPVAESLTGWVSKEAVGRPLDEVFVIINEHHRERLEAPVAKVLREGNVVGLANHTLLVARDGTERPIDDSAAPIRDRSGKVLGVVMVFHDISERRELEKALQERAEELAERDRRKDQFLALLGHELRNPLAPLRNGLQILELQGADAPELTPTIREMMERQVDQLVRLVDDLLDVSRVSRGLLRLRREPIELNTIVTRGLETTRPIVEQREHRLTVELADEPVWLQGDPVRLEQIFCNLLINAARYTDTGGHIRIIARRETSWATLRIVDNGIGIRPEMLSQIFDMFSQADRVRGRAQEGLGLGLTLVKSLTELHGGEVRAHSAGLGQGSEFMVRFPVANDLPNPAKAARASGAPPQTPLRVLIVDDNVDAAKSLGMLLQLAGHQVELAHDGRTALERAPQYRPALVLLDIGLPGGMDGYQVAERLRQSGRLKNRPLLVALTGFGQQEDRRRALAAGFDAHLVKPADKGALEPLLARAAEQGERDSV